MRVLVSGSHGLIGSALVDRLQREGHDPLRLVRSAEAGPGEVAWDPREGRLEARSLEGLDGVVHLAGAGIGDKRWTAPRKKEILDSRVVSTDLLSRRLAETDSHPPVLISGSAVGYYGDRGDELLDESSAPGAGFLAEVCRQWEAATAPAEAAGIRVVHVRTGIVQTPNGGTLKRLLPLFKIGAGGRLGSGRQYMSWISLDDEVGGILHALQQGSVAGPVNLTAPEPVTNAQFTATLGTVLGRPTFVTAPRFGLSALLGPELVEELLLSGQRVEPKVLLGSGYVFRHPTLEAALRDVLDRPAPVP